MKRSIAFATLLLIVTTGLAAQEQNVQIKPEGDWRGTLDAGVAKLDLVIHIARKDSTLSATLDSPDQGATDLPIESVSVAGNTLRFELRWSGASPQPKSCGEKARNKLIAGYPQRVTRPVRR